MQVIPKPSQPFVAVIFQAILQCFTCTRPPNDNFPKSVQKQVKAYWHLQSFCPKDSFIFGFILSRSQRCIRNINIKSRYARFFLLLRPVYWSTYKDAWFGKTNLIRTSGSEDMLTPVTKYTVRQCRRHFFKQLIHRKRRLLYRFCISKDRVETTHSPHFQIPAWHRRSRQELLSVRKGRKATNVSFWIFFSCFQYVAAAAFRSAGLSTRYL